MNRGNDSSDSSCARQRKASADMNLARKESSINLSRASIPDPTHTLHRPDLIHPYKQTNRCQHHRAMRIGRNKHALNLLMIFLREFMHLRHSHLCFVPW